MKALRKDGKVLKVIADLFENVRVEEYDEDWHGEIEGTRIVFDIDTEKDEWFIYRIENEKLIFEFAYCLDEKIFPREIKDISELKEMKEK